MTVMKKLKSINEPFIPAETWRQAVKSFHFRKQYCPMWLDDSDIRKTSLMFVLREIQSSASFFLSFSFSFSFHLHYPTSDLKAQSRWPHQLGIPKSQGFNRRAVGSPTSDALCPSPAVRPRDHSGPCLRASPGVSGPRSSSSRIRRRGWVPATAADRAVRGVRTAARERHV
jgi:hypothetical protein